MGKKIEINKGDTYWRLEIIKEVTWKGRTHVECKCECWNIKVIRLSSIINWSSKSCWCWIKNGNDTHIPKRRMIAISSTRIYKIWLEVKNNLINYNQKWGKFEWFYKDMLPTYKHWLNIKRINNSLDYTKENCEWA